MKKSTWPKLLIAVLALAAVAPAFANTISVPSEDHPAYSVDVPSDWKPKVADEALEATEPDNHVYLSAWVVTKNDVGELKSDLADTLKDSLKSIDGKPEEETIESNGTKFNVLRGHGVDKREGGKVTFMVAIFPAGSGKAGIFYVDWDSDAPSDIKDKINTMMSTIKVHG